jgi:hypothetical protein
MAYFHTKNPNWGKIWENVGMCIFGHLIHTCYCHLAYLKTLVYFAVLVVYFF